MQLGHKASKEEVKAIFSSDVKGGPLTVNHIYCFKTWNQTKRV